MSPNFLVWKLCGNCAFPQNFRTSKLGEIAVFYAVIIRRSFIKTMRYPISYHITLGRSGLDVAYVLP